MKPELTCPQLHGSRPDSAAAEHRCDVNTRNPVMPCRRLRREERLRLAEPRTPRSTEQPNRIARDHPPNTPEILPQPVATAVPRGHPPRGESGHGPAVAAVRVAERTPGRRRASRHLGRRERTSPAAGAAPPAADVGQQGSVGETEEAVTTTAVVDSDRPSGRSACQPHSSFGGIMPVPSRRSTRCSSRDAERSRPNSARPSG